MLALFKKSFWLVIPGFLLTALISMACSPSAGLPQAADANKLQPENPAAIGQSKQTWEKEWDKVLAEAKKERTVVVTGGYGVATSKDAFIRAMKDKFGIVTDIIIAQGGPTAARITSERRAGIYQNDVYVGGANTLDDPLIKRNFVQPIEPYLIFPDIKDPKSWFGGELPVC